MNARRLFTWIMCGSAALVLLFLAAITQGLCLFLVSVTNSPGGQIEFAGTTRWLKAGSSRLIVPVVVRSDSDFALRCGTTVRRIGYITPGLDLAVYVDIRGCDIATYKTFF